MASVMAHTWNVVAVGGGPATPDLAEARRALVVLVDPDARHELRGLPSGRSRLVRGDDPDGALRAVEALCDDRGVYYTLNPVRPDLGDRAAKNVDVTARRWMLVDCDPAKAHRDGNATDAEQAAARAVAQAVHDDLAGRGWPAPLLVDSGNGWHLLYRLDLPNDADARQLVAGSLKALAAAHDTPGATIDRKVHNASRVAKLPGTWARKGPDTADRPHRMCRLVLVPTAVTPVPVELLRDLAGLAAGAPAEQYPRLAPWGVRAAGGGHAAYVRAAVDRELGRVALAPEGDRNNILNDAAFRLGTLLGSGEVGRADLEASLADAARRAGLGEAETRATIRSALDAGQAAPRTLPERPAVSGKAGPAPGPIDPTACVIDRASSIVPRKVEWLWPGRIPLGKLTTFAGWGGLGKTFLLCHISALVSRGDEWPEAGGECADPGQVLFISGEDDADDTLVPRMIEMGADLDRIVFLKTEVQDRFTLADLATLDAAILQAGPDVRFVAIDPPTAYLGSVNDHKNSELRGLLSPLKSWAARHRVALVFNTHVTKPQAAKVEAMARVMGSVAWVNAVRAAHMIAKDPGDPTRRLFVPMKNNLGPERKGLSYRITITDALARLDWLGEVETTADEAISPADAKVPRRQVASEWLADRFRERPEWRSEDLFRAAKEEGISRDAIFEAKRSIGLPRARRHVGQDGSVTYTWWAPPDWSPSNEKTSCDSTTVRQ